MEGLTSFAYPLFSGAEGTEVLSSLRHGITEQPENDATSLASFDVLEWHVRFVGCGIHSKIP